MEGPGLRGKETEVVGANSVSGSAHPVVASKWLPRTLATTDLKPHYSTTLGTTNKPNWNYKCHCRWRKCNPRNHYIYNCSHYYTCRNRWC
jgi:hypothetical protein